MTLRVESIKVSHHPAKFDGHSHSGSNDIIFLACQVTLQDQVIKGSCDFIGTSQSRQVIIWPSLVAIGTLVLEIKCFWSAMWSCKTKWSKSYIKLWLRAPQGKSPWHYGSGIIMVLVSWSFNAMWSKGYVRSYNLAKFGGNSHPGIVEL